MSRADQKARWASARAGAGQAIPRPVDVRIPGWSGWTAGELLVTMPTLKAGAPGRVRRLYRDRLVANLAGECPRCGAVVGLRPGSGPVMRERMIHRPGCLVWEDPEIEPWLERP